MASYLDKFKIKTAIQDNTKLDLSCQHITTSDFFQLSPIYNKEMVPGEKLSVNVESFTRLAPMAVPTFGRIKMKNRAFFVPFRTVWKGWNDFITDTTHVFSGQGSNVSQIGSKVPTILNSTIVAMFEQTAWSTEVHPASEQTEPAAGSYDIKVRHIDQDTSETTYYFKLNYNGRLALKLLQSLGYNIIWYVDERGSAANPDADLTFSALPILALCKVYCDWYFPSAYYDSTVRTNLESLFVYDESATGKILTYSELTNALQTVIRTNYDSDYFVSAFDSPVGPITNAFSSDVAAVFDGTNVDPSLAVNTSFNSKLTISSLNGTPFIRANSSTTTESSATGRIGYLSELMLHGLHSLNDYMKRHQLVGARALDRYLARFGKTLSSEQANRSQYLGSQEIPVQIGDVMSNAKTDSALLGSYAGKGIGYDGSTFDYETNEYGMFIVINTIVPTVGYYQGIDRNVCHTSRLDFWTPEFDQMGNQAISKMELFTPDWDTDDAVNDGTLSTGVFGWTPRYAEYKVGRDKLTGDWRIASLSQAGDVSDSWHLLRKIDPSASSDLVHSSGFVIGDDYSQYDRIFQNTTSKADHFYLIHNFNVVSYSPMCPLYDTYEFENSKGKEITADVNGVKVN